MSKDRVQKPECLFYVCCGSKCRKRGGKAVFKALKAEVRARRLKRVVQVIRTGCTDRCKHGPVLAVMPRNEWHLGVGESHAAHILDEVITTLPSRI